MGLKVLCVETNDDYLSQLRFQLAEKYNVVTASNLRSALFVIEHQEIDAVVMNMPSDCNEAVRYINAVKKRCSDIFIIVLSTSCDIEIRMAVIEAGAADFVPKSDNMNELVAVLDRIDSFKSRHAALIDTETLSNIDGISLKNFIQMAEREYIKRILKRNRGNRMRTAKDLGIGRSTFYVKLKELALA